MKFELAKQLKDAGLPQEIGFGDVMYAVAHERIACAGDDKCYCPYHQDFLYFKIPTLSELIEACGKHVDIEIRETKSWARKLVGSIDIVKGEGSTPEEAVAKLWLALNHG